MEISAYSTTTESRSTIIDKNKYRKRSSQEEP